MRSCFIFLDHFIGLSSRYKLQYRCLTSFLKCSVNRMKDWATPSSTDETDKSSAVFSLFVHCSLHIQINRWGTTRLLLRVFQPNSIYFSEKKKHINLVFCESIILISPFRPSWTPESTLLHFLQTLLDLIESFQSHLSQATQMLFYSVLMC